METPTKPTNNNNPGSVTPTRPSQADDNLLFDSQVLVDSINKILLLILNATQNQIDSSPVFSESASIDRLTRFGTDSNSRVIYLYKNRRPEQNSNNPTSNNDQDSSFSFVYTLKFDMDYSPNLHTTLVLIKRIGLAPSNQDGGTGKEIIKPSTITSSQSNPYEELHNLVHLAVAPFFEAYVNSKSKSKNINDSSINNTPNNQTSGVLTLVIQTKPAILLLVTPLLNSLLHLQQNVEIPEITLILHPVILNLIDKARENKSLDPNLLKDDKFLNKLQSLVNTWIKEIQNVTTLNRDVESGTASQEINFWLSMEKALQGVEEQLKSEPITLTLDILKTAKRYHTTVSFLADTGLKEASDNVHKYNLLMKDFPLNELLAATDLEKIQESLVQIFGHINKKLKISPYPIRRALPLAEAISKDLTESLLKVLTNQRLMYMEHESFSKIMGSAAGVFQTWEEQIKDFTTIARELTRKRNEKFIPIKINASHLELKKRCEYLKGFRKQHEQLRIMTGRDQGISRLDLGSVAGNPTLSNRDSSGGGGTNLGELTDLDMEDEVRAAYESVKNVDVLDASSEGTQIWTTAEAAYNERVSRVENQIIAR
ncbi:hypothetical protein H4Q26_006174 [Puccinia striiformis f. sp. tritici PST-130]|nr:hypothetical protein H4Q26_006174 [Puccinia striiformis f. sp. tritici PST-130]